MAVTEQDVLSALKSCYDPEIPVNIVDLGLIYKVDFCPAAAKRSKDVIRGNDPHRSRMSRTRQHQHAGQITARAVARRPQLRGERRVDSAVDSRATQSGSEETAGHRVSLIPVRPQTAKI